MLNRAPTVGFPDRNGYLFYWAIKRLVDVDLLKEVPAPSADVADERRRFYALTVFGREVLKREVEVLAEIVGYAESQKLIRRAKVM